MAMRSLVSCTSGKLQTRVEWRNSHPILLEKESIKVAIIPVKGEKLQDSIILHPRYVPLRMPHKIVPVNGFRRGRTIDILLDEPIIVEEKEKWVMNFKGVGADADKPMIIHPALWYRLRTASWVPRKEEIYESMRIWGALTSKAAKSEIEDNVLAMHGIDCVAHLQINRLPADAAKRIEELGGRKLEEPLSQLVRACETNIRLDEQNRILSHFNIDDWLDPKRIAEIDAAVVKAHLSLIRKGRLLYINGVVNENRYIDGTFTDSENYDVRNSTAAGGYIGCLAFHALRSSLLSLLPQDKHKQYLEVLEEKTGLDVIGIARWKEASGTSLSEMIMEALQRAAMAGFEKYC